MNKIVIKFHLQFLYFHFIKNENDFVKLSKVLNDHILKPNFEQASIWCLQPLKVLVI